MMILFQPFSARKTNSAYHCFCEHRYFIYLYIIWLFFWFDKQAKRTALFSPVRWPTLSRRWGPGRSLPSLTCRQDEQFSYVWERSSKFFIFTRSLPVFDVDQACRSDIRSASHMWPANAFKLALKAQNCEHLTRLFDSVNVPILALGHV